MFVWCLCDVYVRCDVCLMYMWNVMFVCCICWIWFLLCLSGLWCLHGDVMFAWYLCRMWWLFDDNVGGYVCVMFMWNVMFLWYLSGMWCLYGFYTWCVVCMKSVWDVIVCAVQMGMWDVMFLWCICVMSMHDAMSICNVIVVYVCLCDVTNFPSEIEILSNILHLLLQPKILSNASLHTYTHF